MLSVTYKPLVLTSIMQNEYHLAVYSGYDISTPKVPYSNGIFLVKYLTRLERVTSGKYSSLLCHTFSDKEKVL
jgi:hypothetical protein